MSTELSLQEVYKRWAANRVGCSTSYVSEVSFWSTHVEGSSDINSDDFSTFAGDEVHGANIRFKDGTSKMIRLFDENPVNVIMEFVKRKDYKIIKDVVTEDDLVKMAISKDIDGD